MFGLFLLVSISSTPPAAMQTEAFEVTASASALMPGAAYYTKIRLGNSISALTRGQTFNPGNDAPDDWLTDTDSYALFPQITADAAGIWQGKLIVRPADSAVVGDNLMVLRMRKTDATTNYDSQPVSLRVDPAPTPTVTPTQTPTPAPTNTPTLTPTSATTATKTPTATPMATKTPTLSPSVTPTNAVIPEEEEEVAILGETIEVATESVTSKRIGRPFAIAFALVGLGLGILSAVFIWKKKDSILSL